MPPEVLCVGIASPHGLRRLGQMPAKEAMSAGRAGHICHMRSQGDRRQKTAQLVPTPVPEPGTHTGMGGEGRLGFSSVGQPFPNCCVLRMLIGALRKSETNT